MKIKSEADDLFGELMEASQKELNVVEERQIFLYDMITVDSCQKIIQQILRANDDDFDLAVEDREPIRMFINCMGGDATEGNILADFIKASKTPIYTIALSKVYSASIYVYVSGTKRFAFNNSSFLIHEGEIGFRTSPTKANDLIRFFKEQDRCANRIITDNTSITEKMLKQKSQNEWYVYATEALKLGITDCIIKSIDEVTT